MNKLIAIITGVLLLQQVSAQQNWPLFRVYAVHGKIYLQKPSVKDNAVIIKDSYIYAGQSIIIGDEKSSIILFDKDTNFIELQTKGIYSTNTIQSYKKEHLREGITSRYAHFFWDEFLSPRPGMGKKDDQVIAQSHGGVSRGNQSLALISPSLSFHSSLDQCIFKWNKIKAAGSYHFIMNNENDEEVCNKVLKDTVFVVNCKDSLPSGIYHWQLTCSGSMEKISGLFERVDENKVLAGLSRNMKDTLDGVMHDLQLAELYEKNGCTKKALSVYTALVKKYPADKSLRRLYDEFKWNNYIPGKGKQ